MKIIRIRPNRPATTVLYFENAADALESYNFLVATAPEGYSYLMQD